MPCATSSFSGWTSTSHSSLFCAVLKDMSVHAWFVTDIIQSSFNQSTSDSQAMLTHGWLAHACGVVGAHACACPHAGAVHHASLAHAVLLSACKQSGEVVVQHHRDDQAFD
jgi:hypothetical protein